MTPTGNPMSWPEAVAAMRSGHTVRRLRDTFVVGTGVIRTTGRDGCILAHGWTEDERAVRVFMGAESKCLFVPDGDDRTATDWMIEGELNG